MTHTERIGKSDEEKQKRSGWNARPGALRAGAMFTQLPKRDRYVRVNFVIGKRERRNSAHPPREIANRARIVDKSNQRLTEVIRLIFLIFRRCPLARIYLDWE